MDVKSVAQEAAKLFNGEYGGYNSIERSLLKGYFEGVQNGTNTIGQKWVGELISTRVIGCDGKQFEKKEHELIVKIAASGMCSEGQPLSAKRTKSFAERT